MAKDSDHDWSELDLLFLIWSQSPNPFFEAVLPALAALPAELARRMVGLQDPSRLAIDREEPFMGGVVVHMSKHIATR